MKPSRSNPIGQFAERLTNSFEMLAEARETEKGCQCEPPTLAVPLGAAAPGREPAVTWGTTEPAVTPRPQHPGLSGGARPLLLCTRHLRTLESGVNRTKGVYLARLSCCSAGLLGPALDRLR